MPKVVLPEVAVAAAVRGWSLVAAVGWSPVRLVAAGRWFARVWRSLLVASSAGRSPTGATMVVAWSPRTTTVVSPTLVGVVVVRRVVRAMAARRTIITSSSTLSTSAAGGIAATPRAGQSPAWAWATLSTKLTAAAPPSRALGQATSHQARWAWWTPSHRSAPVATTMNESTSSGIAHACSGVIPPEVLAYDLMASKLVKNATAPTAPATAAMMATSAAWKRWSQASAAWTVGSAMLRIGGGVRVGRPGWAVGGPEVEVSGMGSGSLGQRLVARSPSTIPAIARPTALMATVPTMAATVASTVATSATIATTVPAVMPATVSTRVMAVAGCIRPKVSSASTDAGTRAGSASWR